MKDLLPPAPSWIQEATLPLAEALGLRTLPLHIHEVLLSFFFYLFLDNVFAPLVSTWVCPKRYSQLPTRTRINWNIHIVSLVQAAVICSLALWVILVDEDRKAMSPADRIWGYGGATGLAQAFAAGYFLWDAVVCTTTLGIQGWGALAHAIGALIITNLGFRPFANYYGVSFVLYELSTPFLNFHWFFDKCDMTGTTPQLWNGIALIITFFGCRLVWGTYLSVRIYKDIFDVYAATNAQTPIYKKQSGLRDTHLFDDNSLPTWLVVVYLGSNTLLAGLNFYWFGLMLQAVAKRFPQAKSGKPKGVTKTE